MANWSQLPYDLILIIVNRLNTMEDFLAFSGVCRSWRSVYSSKNWTPGPLFPWLMLSEKANSSKRGFFSFCRKKIFELDLPEARGRRCWGSSDGWLITIGFDLQIRLLNPITRVQIDLPPQYTFQNQPDYEVYHCNLLWVRSCFIHKAILLKTSALSLETENNFLVAAIYGEHHDLALAKPGNKAWITVETSPRFHFRDVACCKGQFFALTDFGTLVVVDIGGPNPPRAKFIVPPPSETAEFQQIYLVESSGDLLMVVRHGKRNDELDIFQETLYFKIFEFDFNTLEWTEIEDLGDRVLFVGDNCSMSRCASGIANFKCNSIYFTDDALEQWYEYELNYGGHDMGVYNMKSKTIQCHYTGEDFPSYYFFPIWVTPSFNW